MEREKIVALLTECTLFDHLDAIQLVALAKHMEIEEANAKQILFQEGELGDRFYFIIEGQCEVLKDTDTGDVMTLATFGPGRVFGEMAIVDHEPRSATVRTKTRTKVLTLAQDGFNKIAETRPEIALEILKNVARLLSLNLRNTSGSLVASREV